MAWTYFNKLAASLGQRLSGLFQMEPSTGRSLLYEVQNESKGNIDTITGTTIPAAVARIVALEQIISAPVADTTALKAIAAASRFDKMLAFCESAADGLGHLYRFDSGSVAAEDLPFVVAPTAGTGRWLIDEEAEREMGSAVADITALKAVTAAQRTGGQVRFCASNGTHADLYFFSAASGAVESLPDVVAPTVGTGRWLSYRAALKVYFDTIYALTGHTHATLPTAIEKTALPFFQGSAISFWLPSVALPVGAPVGARYVAGNSGNGWTIHRLYELASQGPDVWTEITPAYGAIVTVKNEIPSHYNGTWAYLNYAGNIGWTRLAAEADGRIGGSVAVAVMYGAGVFTAGDDVDIGADTYVCAAIPAAPFEFAPGGTRAIGLANLLATANGAFGTVPTEAVLLDVDGDNLRAINADGPMGDPVDGVPPSVGFAVSITGPSTAAWSVANLNELGSDVAIDSGRCVIEVSAEMAAAIAAGGATLGAVTFTPTARSLFKVQVMQATGEVRSDVTDQFALNGDGSVTITASGAVHVLATDVISWIAYE